MSRSIKAILILISMAAVSRAQQPAQPAAGYSASSPPWVVSVVHIVDSQKIIERLRKDKSRVGVSGTAPENVYNIATGLVVDERGHVITRLANLDPEDKDQTISVTTADGRSLPARLVGVDCATGFAVLEASSLKVSTPPTAADALTNNLAVNILTADVRARVINASGVEKTYLYPAMTQAGGLIKTDNLTARLNNSVALLSGSLLSRSDSSIVTTEDNKVVGMAQYIGYGQAKVYSLIFIRDTVAKRVIEKQGSVPAGWLGVVGKSITEISESELATLGLAQRAGVLVREISPNSPAAVSGLLLNDVVVGVDDLDITGASDLQALVISSPAGRNIKLRAIRDHKAVEIQVVLGARPVSLEEISNITKAQREVGTSEPAQLIARHKVLGEQWKAIRRELVERSRRYPNSAPPKELKEKVAELEIEIRQILDRLSALGVSDLNVAPAPRNAPNGVDAALTQNPDISFPLGFTGRDLSAQLAAVFKVENGVLVSSVAKDSPAARAGIEPADVIVGSDKQEQINAVLLLRMLSNQREDIVLKVMRKGQIVAITLKK